MSITLRTALQNIKAACPFCGSDKCGIAGSGLYVTVICHECLAEGPHGTLKEAVERWNNRPESPSPMNQDDF